MNAIRALMLFICVAIPKLLLADDFESANLDNWSQWRGPNADGVAPRANPPLHWDETTNIKWKVPIPGKGAATPIVWKDRIFVLTAIDTGREPEAEKDAAPPASSEGSRHPMTREASTLHEFVILCLDKATGEVLWKQVAATEVPREGGHLTNTYASASPTTDGEFVYASFGSHGIYCYTIDGDLVWKRDLGDMTTRRGFGEGASPALHGDRLVVNWDHEGDSFITCLDARSGEDIWTTPRDEVTTWVTPLIVEHDGKTQVVTNGTNRSRGYDLETGQLLWECGGQATNPIASPVTHDGLVICMTGHRGYALSAIPLDAIGDITRTNKIAWTRDRGTSYIASPLVHDGLLYFTKSRNGILSCVDAKTGEEVYVDKRLPAINTIYASLAAADGKLFIVGRDGTTVVIELGRDFNVLATNPLGEGIDASPVLVGDQMFLRGAEHLYCISAG